MNKCPKCNKILDPAFQGYPGVCGCLEIEELIDIPLEECKQIAPIMKQLNIKNDGHYSILDGRGTAMIPKYHLATLISTLPHFIRLIEVKPRNKSLITTEFSALFNHKFNVGELTEIRQLIYNLNSANISRVISSACRLLILLDQKGLMMVNNG